MRILFCTHTGAWSGAEAALVELMESVRGEHEIAVACPDSGPFAVEMDRAGVPRWPLPSVEVGFRLRPWQTPRSLAQLGLAGLFLARAIRQFRPDVVHASTVRAGLVGAIGTRLGGPPLVVRVHDHLPLSPLGRLVRRIIAGSASQVVAVSDYTAARFNEGLARPLATCLYNGIDHTRFDPDRVAPAPLRSELGIIAGTPLLGQVAQITPWKGQDTAIRALAEVRRAGTDAHLLIVGTVTFEGKHVRYDNHAYLRGLHRLAGELAVGDAVHFVGQRSDVPAVLRALDLLLLPSWDEPFALVVMESMAMGTPALVGNVGGAPEVLEQGVTGMVLPPKQPALWAEAVSDLLRDGHALDEIGARARHVAASFSRERHAQQMLAVYGRVMNGAVSESPNSGRRRRPAR